MSLFDIGSIDDEIDNLNLKEAKIAKMTVEELDAHLEVHSQL